MKTSQVIGAIDGGELLVPFSVLWYFPFYITGFPKQRCSWKKSMNGHSRITQVLNPQVSEVGTDGPDPGSGSRDRDPVSLKERRP